MLQNGVKNFEAHLYPGDFPTLDAIAAYCRSFATARQAQPIDERPMRARPSSAFLHLCREARILSPGQLKS
jgi:hypothetical protein